MSEASPREGGRDNGVPKQRKLTGLTSLSRPYNGETLSGKPGSICLLDSMYYTGLKPREMGWSLSRTVISCTRLIPVASWTVLTVEVVMAL
ncbi:hypothetical protein BHE74_00046447 [Ensete ventricosum]|nr:hypothetical protein GW17_00048925 [Ensete ventricosum]RWW47548.1 hypothetical protein BHE74_00046447 [Ensete ventricosum]RZR87966.1 hypothetical protein BHM03_00015436 [Ensete ventricosum]